MCWISGCSQTSWINLRWGQPPEKRIWHFTAWGEPGLLYIAVNLGQCKPVNPGPEMEVEETTSPKSERVGPHRLLAYN